MDLDDESLLRYSRQIMLPGIDYEGQQKLLAARVLIVGLGGLGSPVAMYLAASGVGELRLCDDDVVDLSNLQRQVIHATGDIGSPKVESAARRVAALNPGVRVVTLGERLDAEALHRQAGEVDVVVDCTDNLRARFAMNDACVATGTPLVMGAAIRLDAQVSVFDTRHGDSPCYRCLYAEEGEIEERCAETGVLGSMVGIVGCVQATETIRLLAGFGEGLTGRLLVLDARDMRFREFRLRRDPQCPACRDRPVSASTGAALGENQPA